MLRNETTNKNTSDATPAPCQDDIFKNGHTVFVLCSWKSEDIEAWVREVAKKSGEKVDWHYSGSRANILGLGDNGAFEKIRNAIKEMLPELNNKIKAYYQANYGGNSFFSPVNYTEKDVDYWNNNEMYRSSFLSPSNT